MYYNPTDGWSKNYDIFSNTTAEISGNSQIAINKNGDAIWIMIGKLFHKF